MNKKSTKPISEIVIIVIFFIAFTKIHALPVESPYEVGTWEGFRSAAVTFTFDDGLKNQITYAAPLFDSLGFKATFYIIVNNRPDWAVYKKLAKEGHEIGSHTYSHPDSLAGMATEDFELSRSQIEINLRIPGNQCITIAYPLCRAGDDSLASKYYVAGRTCQGRIESKTPEDFYSISAIGCGAQSPLKTVQDLNSKADQSAQLNGWCVFVAHEINDGKGYSPLPASVIEGNLKYLDQNRDKFWVSTFSNVVRYIKERDSINIKSITNQENFITLSVTDNLPDSIYNVPVTIRRPLPDDWDAAFVEQNDSLIESAVVESKGRKCVMFDAIPDKGNVNILKGITTVYNSRKTAHYPRDLRVWFDNSRLTIRTKNISVSDLKVILFDLRGKTIGTFAFANNSSTYRSIALPAGIQWHCMYIAKITDGKTTISNEHVTRNH
jgi:hypothetical protein